MYNYSNRHWKDQIPNIEKNGYVLLATPLSRMIISKYFKKYGIDEKDLNLTYYTLDQLLDGEMDYMKGQFDYIVGNPPYQYSSDEAKSKKLYIDITKKIVGLLKKDGIVSFVTPQAILDDGQGNSVFEYLKNNLIEVNYDANNQFNIGQKVISWTCKNSKNKTDKIKIIDNSDSRNVESIYDVCRLENSTVLSILNKLSFKINGKAKCDIAKADKRNGIANKLLSDEKNEKFNVPVYCNTKTHRIKYCNENDKLNTYKQIILPYSEVWDPDNIRISDEETNFFFMVNSKKEPVSVLKNMMSYFKSKLMAYSVIHYNNVVKSTGNNNFLFRVSQIDFSKPWTDEELYKEFNITEEEQKVIEDWYKEWKK